MRLRKLHCKRYQPFDEPCEFCGQPATHRIEHRGMNQVYYRCDRHKPHSQHSAPTPRLSRDSFSYWLVKMAQL